MQLDLFRLSYIVYRPFGSLNTNKNRYTWHFQSPTRLLKISRLCNMNCTFIKITRCTNEIVRYIKNTELHLMLKFSARYIPLHIEEIRTNFVYCGGTLGKPTKENKNVFYMLQNQMKFLRSDEQFDRYIVVYYKNI